MLTVMILKRVSESIFFQNNKFTVSKIKVELLLSKKNYNIYLNGNSFKNDEKCFLFHLENSFYSQDI